MRLVFLGTGTSHGVPTIDCMLANYARCPKLVCQKATTDPRHRRTRASLLIEHAGTSLLVDTSQDFRQQVLENRVRRISAVLYTHGHADHIYGLPDIRSYCYRQGDAIDIYASEETLGIVRGAFGYVFDPPDYVGGGIPSVRTHVLTDPTRIGGLDVLPIPVEHGALSGCQGYRVGDVAYIPDAKVIPPESLERLMGLEVLIINCLRIRPHGSHLSLAESLEYVRLLRPRRAYLTHMTHDIDYEEVEPDLPASVRFAFDGLSLDAPC